MHNSIVLQPLARTAVVSHAPRESCDLRRLWRVAVLLRCSQLRCDRDSTNQQKRFLKEVAHEPPKLFPPGVSGPIPKESGISRVKIVANVGNV